MPDFLEVSLPKIKTVSSPLIEYIRLGLENNALPLTSGQPAPEASPLSRLSDLAGEAIRLYGHRTLIYGSNRGWGPLRGWIGAWQAREKVVPSGLPEESLMLTLGSQYAFDLLCQALLEPGAIVAMDAPCYPDSWCTVLRRGGEVLPIPLDEEGIDVDYLAFRLQEGLRPALLYTILYYQNPSGTSLSPERQRRLVELAEKYDFLLILDDPYRMLPLDGPHESGSLLLPWHGFDLGRTVYLGSMSKLIAPGLRSGWLYAHPSLVAKLAKLQEMSMISLPALDATILFHFLETDGIETQLGSIRSFLKTRRDALIGALEKETFPLGCHVTRPKGGCFLRLELPPQIGASSFATKLTKEYRVATIPEGAFWPPVEDPKMKRDRFLRLSFTWSPPEELVQAATLIGKALKEVLRGKGETRP